MTKSLIQSSIFRRRYSDRESPNIALHGCIFVCILSCNAMLEDPKKNSEAEEAGCINKNTYKGTLENNPHKVLKTPRNQSHKQKPMTEAQQSTPSGRRGSPFKRKKGMT